MNESPPRKKQATPVELAALLMETVRRPSGAEESALRELAEYLGVGLQSMQSELMFLRAFAVDFATGIALGDSAEKQAILERYYQHWEIMDNEAESDVLDQLQDRLQLYFDAIDSPESGPAGLGSQVGLAFATRCDETGEWREDLAMLGGSMFAALFDEVTDLLQEVEIVVYEA